MAPQHNPALNAPLPHPTKPNSPCWTPADAATFLRHRLVPWVGHLRPN